MITKWESGYILKVYIGADFVPTDINRILFENGDMESINLKSPTDNDTPIDKFGHNLKSPIKTINGFTAIQNYLSCEAHHELFLQGIKNINRN